MGDSKRTTGVGVGVGGENQISKHKNKPHEAKFQIFSHSENKIMVINGVSECL